jgi:hypothetical protein
MKYDNFYFKNHKTYIQRFSPCWLGKKSTNGTINLKIDIDGLISTKRNK